MTHKEKRARIKMLRKEAQLLRAGIPDKENKNQKIRETVRELVNSGFSRVFVFASYKDEAETKGLILNLIKEGTAVFCPRVEGQDMTFYRLLGLEDLKEGYKGIPEPDLEKGLESDAPSPDDLMLVPGLLFDREGGRIGYGGGYYDRYMEAHPCVRAGLCFSDQIREEKLPQMPWDISVDLLVSDQGTLNTGTK